MSISSDSQYVDRSQAGEDYPLSAVPFESRKPIWSLAPLLMGFALTSTTLFAGGLVGSAFPFSTMLTIVLIGNLLLGTYCAAMGYIAQRSGLTTVLMSRFSFGNVGSRWVDFVLGFTQIGWYAVTNAFIADALTKQFGLSDGMKVFLTVFFTFAFCVTAYIGYTAMDWLSRLAVPAMLVLIAISLIRGFGDAGDLASLQPSQQMGLGAAIATVMSTFISGGTQSTNWSRFADTPKNAIWSTFLAFFFINGLLVFTGAFTTLVYGSEDLIAAMAKQGLLLGSLVLLILNVWTTQDNTIYAFSVAGTNFFRTTKRHAFVIGGALFALLLALTGIYENLITYLLLLGTLIPPIGGIIMTDFWLRHRGQFPSLDTPLPAFNWAGVIAYVAAALIAYFTGTAGIGIGPLNGIISAAILYAVLTKVIPQPIRVTEM
ncbi:cytosine permease [Thermoleptolyngbya sp. C42_A2020_037]|uniref:cytosine permease n=1 Tax=Thermoleptolyngbya sp. C42_A2020_037 TaxID=2747799 RepID=UPI001A09037E|nr:cytosine permease [Thermoleptolyngbya sp. C42_A2020_037]MBF2085732.1 cytosine permease [Thermoleptolyngbya sp. C42_A2020_037]